MLHHNFFPPFFLVIISLLWWLFQLHIHLMVLIIITGFKLWSPFGIFYFRLESVVVTFLHNSKTLHFLNFKETFCSYILNIYAYQRAYLQNPFKFINSIMKWIKRNQWMHGCTCYHRRSYILSLLCAAVDQNMFNAALRHVFINIWLIFPYVCPVSLLYFQTDPIQYCHFILYT